MKALKPLPTWEQNQEDSRSDRLIIQEKCLECLPVNAYTLTRAVQDKIVDDKCQLRGPDEVSRRYHLHLQKSCRLSWTFTAPMVLKLSSTSPVQT
jgi:hypothetical protein